MKELIKTIVLFFIGGNLALSSIFLTMHFMDPSVLEGNGEAIQNLYIFSNILISIVSVFAVLVKLMICAYDKFVEKEYTC